MFTNLEEDFLKYLWRFYIIVKVPNEENECNRVVIGRLEVVSNHFLHYYKKSDRFINRIVFYKISKISQIYMDKIRQENEFF